MEPLQTWWTTELYPTSDEDNFGVVGNFEVVKAADAQATIATLQARLESANKLIHKKNCDLGRAEAIVNDLQAELERVRGELDHAKKMEAVQKEVADNQTWHVQKLRTLILALPKVEGEIVAQGGYVKDRNKVYACFGSDADMTAYAAIVQHRQGMEG